MGKAPSRARIILLTSALVLLVLLASCSNLGYYGQAAVGQARILIKRKPIARLLADPETPAALREKLRAADAYREFAEAELGLAANGSYTSYVELPPDAEGGRRSAVVWNVVAAPELSVVPLTWCFPVAGCVSYRGYFSETRARRFAERLQHRGYEVRVAGASAYSTLGWFEDPLLSTVIDYPEAHLAGLIFHELAHQKVYLEGDTPFNESFATAVEVEGVRRWLSQVGEGTAKVEAYVAAMHREDQLTELLLGFRSQLEAIYGGDEPEAWKRQRKAEVLHELQLACQSLEASWDDRSLGRWSSGSINNADLVSVGSYHGLVATFQQLLENHSGDLEAFYRSVQALAALSPEARHLALAEMTPS